MNLAVALGVMAGTAVLTGALLVGDSVRGSLRHLTLDGLGGVDEALVSDRFFRTELADELAATPAFSRASTAAPLIFLEGSVSQPDSGNRANRVTLIAGDKRLRELGFDSSSAGAGNVVVNKPLADDLGVKPGQDVIVRLPTPADIPRDSALGRKTETITNRRLTVKAIIPSEGVGRFSLRPNQQAPRIAYLELGDLQDALRQPKRCNAIFVGHEGRAADPKPTDHERLEGEFKPKLADLSLAVAPRKLGYFQAISERMMLEPEAERSALKAFADRSPQPVLTYLANSLSAGKKEVPYSTIAAIDFTAVAPLGPLTTPTGETIAALADDEIVLNDWAADDLQVKPGDEIRVTYFEPESTHGQVRESSATFKLKAICALSGLAADPDLTPELAGVTDQLSIANWNPPFPFESERVRKKDEDYWDKHRATPKAFVSLKAGRKLWASRFGQTTSIRLAPKADEKVDQPTADSMAAAWSPDPAAMGFAFRPVRALSLAASSGTTPFNLLFLGFSMFIIAAAIMLVALLFRLGIERRAREIGILLAIGLGARQVRRLLLGEGLIVATLGGLAGVGAGVGYAWLMLAGLRTWWLAAVTTPLLNLYITSTSLIVGYFSGVIVSLLAIAWALRQMRHVAVRRLLADQASDDARVALGEAKVSVWVARVSFVVAIVATVAATQLSGEAQAGAFFGGGALVLTAALAKVWARMRTGSTGPLIAPGGFGLTRLAVRNGARNPGRSTLSIGLVASASFLIVAISAFHLEPPEAYERRESGTGGFALVCESDQPIYQDLNKEDGRFDAGFSAQDEKRMAGATVVPLRVQGGDDASCLNLYQPQQPRVLGVTQTLIARGGFAWAGTAAKTAEEKANPWLLLDRKIADADGREIVPVVIDMATAAYSLHLGGVGSRYEMNDGRGHRMTLEVVGLLANSVLQGTLLIAEPQFLQHFPDVSGYRFFLVDAPRDQVKAIETTLEKTLGDYGLAAESTTARLSEFLAVQNTYLSTFQSLGALGLLLGTFGLATVQARNVLERRGELALLRATGFRRGMLARLVMLENAALLIGGLVVGIVAALVAIAPHLWGGGASIPWNSLAVTLGLVLGVGLLAGLAAVRTVLTTPLLGALRGE
jgi:ABC-type lipoprotein release transport system permease subunit